MWPWTTAGSPPSSARTAAGRDPPPAAWTRRSSTGDQKLADGSTAKIDKLGTQHYRLKIINDGAVLATLEANQRDAGLDANGMYVVFTQSGEVHSWMGGEHSGPGTFKLAGGWTAKVTKVGDAHFRADIIGNEGSVDGTLEANQHDDGMDANGVYIVLSAGGVISAHE
ncbi:Lipoprotein OS=Streptomyces antimycoticus OX=68175 GN=SANT12839_059730 PE=4 SV=1 [Streptomyces antimycoticus]